MSKAQTNSNKLHYLEFDGKRFDFFPSIGLKLTGQCDKHCPFCCEPNRHQKIFGPENFYKIADIISKLGTHRLCLTGGEPLFYNDLDKIVRHTKNLNFYNLLLTSDGDLFIKNISNIIPFLDAVRFSVHDIGPKHDNIVKKFGAFEKIETAIKNLCDSNFTIQITTVVTTKNIDSLCKIAEWCFKLKVKAFFLFGIMKSGKGAEFISKNGEVTKSQIQIAAEKLRQSFLGEDFDIIVYEYKNKAECVLIYGDGRVVIDPYPSSTDFQLEIGNILLEKHTKILERFYQDPGNFEGQHDHYRKFNFTRL